MRFYSRVVFIANICFIISIVLRYVELSQRKTGGTDNVIPLPAVEGTIVIFGFIAVLLNAAFVFIVLYRKSIRKPLLISRFVLWFNLFTLPVQIWYHFISKM